MNPYFDADTVDESAQVTEMAGNQTVLNQVQGQSGWSQSPTKCLVMLWFAVLAAYWFIGYFFKGQRS